MKDVIFKMQKILDLETEFSLKNLKKVKQLTGMTPNDYIRKIRLEKAAELLLTTNMTAAEVAYKVGFDDQYYFSKSFKRYFGQPPSQYRKGSEKSQEES